MATMARLGTNLVTIFTKESCRTAVLTRVTPDPWWTCAFPSHMMTGSPILAGTNLITSIAIKSLKHPTNLITFIAVKSLKKTNNSHYIYCLKITKTSNKSHYIHCSKIPKKPNNSLYIRFCKIPLKFNYNYYCHN